MRLWLPVLTVALASACIRLPDENAAVHAALVYELDQLKVLSIQVDPPYFAPSTPAVIRALAMGPTGSTETLEVSTCGLRTDVTVEVDDVGCFDAGELVEDWGTTPLTWESPDLSGLGCSEQLEAWDTGLPFDSGIPDTALSWLTERTPYVWRQCMSEVPLMVTAQLGDEQARAVLFARLLHYPLSEYEQAVAGDFLTSRELTLRVAGTPTAGGQVELRASLPELTTESQLEFRWSVDAGELSRTSRTLEHGVSDGLTYSFNELTIPEDHTGPLRVAVVAARRFASGIGDEIWAVETLEVP